MGEQHHGTYSPRRALLDVLAVLDLIAIAYTELKEFPGTGVGFKVYAVSVLAVVVVLWLALRRHEFPVWAIAVLQLSFMGHVAGRMVVLDGQELYRATVLGFPGDKLVHAFNSLAAAAFVTALFRRLRFRLRGWEGFVVVMVVSGGGALVEIIEYGGFLLLPVTHVGDYSNNMQDLIANLLGAIAGWLVASIAMRRSADPTLADETEGP